MLYKRILKTFLSFIILTAIVYGILLLISWFNIEKLPVAKNVDSLRIISMNIAANNLLSADFQKDLLDCNSDIIVMIEWTGDNIDLDNFRKAGYKVLLNHPRKAVHGLCILSRIEGNAAILESPVKTPCTLPLGQLRFKWKGRDISLFAVHAPPPVKSCKGTNEAYLTAISGWIENGILNEDIGAGKQGDLVILAGDFNCFSFEKGISAIRNKRLEDAYGKYNPAAQTWKPFKTFPYVAKIDYILYPDNFELLERCRFHIPDSDHLGLIADLDLSIKK